MGINGLAMGMIYALMAMGLILLIRAIGVMNFAQGDLLMLGAYITWALTNDLKLPPAIMVPVAMLSFAFIGIVFMFTVYWPLREASYPAATVISTMGASIVFKELVVLIWGSYTLVSAPIIPGTLKIGTFRLQYQYLIIIGVSVILLLILFFVIRGSIRLFKKKN